jgi:hypothetical protein
MSPSFGLHGKIDGMGEAPNDEFWSRLARRINSGLQASRDNNVRFIWVDDFVPGSFTPDLENNALLAAAFVSKPIPGRDRSMGFASVVAR